jgi:hypothetical protein
MWTIAAVALLSGFVLGQAVSDLLQTRAHATILASLNSELEWERKERHRATEALINLAQRAGHIEPEGEAWEAYAITDEMELETHRARTAPAEPASGPLTGF